MADSISLRHQQLSNTNRSNRDATLGLALSLSAVQTESSTRSFGTDAPSRGCQRPAQHQQQAERIVLPSLPVVAANSKRSTPTSAQSSFGNRPLKATGQVLGFPNGSHTQKQNATQTVSASNTCRPTASASAVANRKKPDLVKLEMFGEALSKELLKTGDDYSVITFHKAMERRFPRCPIQERHVAVHTAICTAREVATLAMAALSGRKDKALINQLTRYTCCFNETAAKTTAINVMKSNDEGKRVKSIDVITCDVPKSSGACCDVVCNASYGVPLKQVKRTPRVFPEIGGSGEDCRTYQMLSEVPTTHNKHVTALTSDLKAGRKRPADTIDNIYCKIPKYRIPRLQHKTEGDKTVTGVAVEHFPAVCSEGCVVRGDEEKTGTVRAQIGSRQHMTLRQMPAVGHQVNETDDFKKIEQQSDSDRPGFRREPDEQKLLPAEYCVVIYGAPEPNYVNYIDCLKADEYFCLKLFRTILNVNVQSHDILRVRRIGSMCLVDHRRPLLVDFTTPGIRNVILSNSANLNEGIHNFRDIVIRPNPRPEEHAMNTERCLRERIDSMFQM